MKKTRTPLTLADIEAHPGDFIPFAMAAAYLHISPVTLREALDNEPQLTGVPYLKFGPRYKIPKARFVQAMKEL